MIGTPEPPPPTSHAPIQRVLIAMDATGACLDALDEVVGLAATLQAEIRGVVVEDTDLRDLAGYTVLSPQLGRGASTLERSTIDRALGLHVSQARHAVEVAARRRRLPVSFEVRRGRTAPEVLRSSSTGDLIVVSRHACGFALGRESAHASAVPMGISPTTRDIVRATAQPMVIVTSATSLRGPIYAVYDGSPTSTLGLALAMRLQQHSATRPVSVLLMARDHDAAAELRQRARTQLASGGACAEFALIVPGRLDTLCVTLSRREAGLIVIANDQRVLRHGPGDNLIDRLAGSLLVVPELASGSRVA